MRRRCNKYTVLASPPVHLVLRLLLGPSERGSLTFGTLTPPPHARALSARFGATNSRGRFAQPWEGMDFDPLDEYLSSSSSAFSSGEDMDVGGGSTSSDDRVVETGGGGRSTPLGKTTGVKRQQAHTHSVSTLLLAGGAAVFLGPVFSCPR